MDLMAKLTDMADSLDIQVFADLDDPTDAWGTQDSLGISKEIHIGKKMTPLGYFISLHEIAHIVHKDRNMYVSRHPLHNEINASYWAFEHFEMGFSPCIQEAAFEALMSYVDGGYPFEDMDKSMIEEMLTPEQAHTIEGE